MGAKRIESRYSDYCFNKLSARWTHNPAMMKAPVIVIVVRTVYGREGHRDKL